MSEDDDEHVWRVRAESALATLVNRVDQHAHHIDDLELRTRDNEIKVARADGLSTQLTANTTQLVTLAEAVANVMKAIAQLEKAIAQFDIRMTSLEKRADEQAQDVRELRRDVDRNLRMTIGFTFACTVSILGIMAHGFGWI